MNAFGLVDQFLAVMPCGFYAIFNSWAVFPALGHTAIAFNRFSSICWQDLHASLWTVRRTRILLAVCLVLTAIASVPSYASSLACVTAEGRLVGAGLADPTLRNVRIIRGPTYLEDRPRPLVSGAIRNQKMPENVGDLSLPMRWCP